MRLSFIRLVLLAGVAVNIASPRDVMAQSPEKPASPGVTINQDRLARLKAAKMPKLDRAIPFDTPEADAILAALEVFPPDNPWNIPVDDWPLHPNSKGMIAAIGGNKPLRYNPDMSFVLVPPDQKMVDVKLAAYAEESDKGPYPVPDNAVIEGWP